jgi:hypothetical protein
MISLIVHALLGISTIAYLVKVNKAIFRRVPSGPRLSSIEIALYAIGIASIIAGWSFNVTFVVQNTDGWVSNPFVGDGSWGQYMKLMFANPAAGSAGIDFSIANVLLLPVVTIIDGRRRGITKPWLYFVVTLFASFTAGWALYAATVERQRRLALEPASETAAQPTADAPA